MTHLSCEARQHAASGYDASGPTFRVVPHDRPHGLSTAFCTRSEPVAASHPMSAPDHNVNNTTARASRGNDPLRASD